MNFSSFDPFVHITVATTIKIAKKAKAYVINQFRSEQKSSTTSSLTETAKKQKQELKSCC